MPTPTKRTYSLATDFGGSINPSKLIAEIDAEAGITVGLYNDQIDVYGDTVDVWFKDPLPAPDATVLDNDSSPAGGLLAAHDSTPSPAEAPVTVVNAPRVHYERITLAQGVARTYVFSPNWCDKTTWYQKSVEVLAEAVGTGDGAQTVFSLAQDNIIDLTHGKVTEEHLVPLPVGATLASWKPVVRVDGVIQAEAVPFGGAANDYSIDYATGDITFTVAPGNTLAVTADYFYSPATAENSCFVFGPPAGKKWTIDLGETQFSVDVTITDTVIFVPCLVSAPAVEVAPRSMYKTLGVYLDYTAGAYPIVPAFGGAQRGLTQDTLIMRWDYHSATVLKASQGVGIKVFLENDNAFGGERATFTLYIKEEDE